MFISHGLKHNSIFVSAFSFMLYVTVFFSAGKYSASESLAGMGADENTLPENAPFSIEIRLDDHMEQLTEEDTYSWRMQRGDEYIWKHSKVSAYFEKVKEIYDSPGNIIHFTTHDGRYMEIASDYCGWKLNVGISVQRFEEAVDAGETVFDPAWNSGLVYTKDSDFGKDYLEVSLSEQKVYLFKDMKLVFQTDCVTGQPGEHTETHPGVFQMYSKQSPATLKGEDQWGYKYEQPVTYWMPFNRAEGLHDATWRSEFGGAIYQTNGSHGCVNLPLESAQRIYQETYLWFPVIIY